MDCGCADGDSETLKSTDDLYPHITLEVVSFLEEKTKSKL